MRHKGKALAILSMLFVVHSAQAQLQQHLLARVVAALHDEISKHDIGGVFTVVREKASADSVTNLQDIVALLGERARLLESESTIRTCHQDTHIIDRTCWHADDGRTLVVKNVTVVADRVLVYVYIVDTVNRTGTTPIVGNLRYYSIIFPIVAGALGTPTVRVQSIVG